MCTLDSHQLPPDFCGFQDKTPLTLDWSSGPDADIKLAILFVVNVLLLAEYGVRKIDYLMIIPKLDG